MTRVEAEKRLKTIFGIEHFYDEQWKAIDRILRGERILMIGDNCNIFSIDCFNA